MSNPERKAPSRQWLVQTVLPPGLICSPVALSPCSASNWAISAADGPGDEGSPRRSPPGSPPPGAGRAWASVNRPLRSRSSRSRRTGSCGRPCRRSPPAQPAPGGPESKSAVSKHAFRHLGQRTPAAAITIMSKARPITPIAVGAAIVGRPPLRFDTHGMRLESLAHGGDALALLGILGQAAADRRTHAGVGPGHAHHAIGGWLEPRQPRRGRRGRAWPPIRRPPDLSAVHAIVRIDFMTPPPQVRSVTMALAAPILQTKFRGSISHSFSATLIVIRTFGPLGLLGSLVPVRLRRRPKQA